ncbi:MAG: SAM-dependent chlorinase/fluorinase [Terriglobia bacterium]|nr:SAM-dependent chlorinase/fluorinase [Terriglobia bacterium]
MSQRLVTFTTDFGTSDHFVGTMRGVILTINPHAQIHDICNSVQSFDVLDGALTIAHAYRYFPANSIHMVIVDPGVGTARRPILVTTEKHMFIAPDNGVLSLVYEREERISVRHITAEHYFLQPTSRTFHGRDVFAATAGWLSKGVEAAKFGDEITDYVRFASPKVKRINDRTLKGVILKVDKFGNLVTNIRQEDLPQLTQELPPDFKIMIGRGEVKRVRNTFAEGAAGEIFAVWGSMGYLEIVANRAYAAQLLQATKGSDVGVVFEQPQWEPNGAAVPAANGE